jgi:DNA-binding NarL/FixJ family response regulator
MSSRDEPAAAFPDPSDGARPLRVLIADDDGFVRKALAATLGAEFEIVATAADAREAVALAEEHEPDAAIVDVNMPGGGGLQATRGILGCSPGTAVIVLSGDESDRTVREVINAGATTYVRKGTPRAELARAVRTSVAASRLKA